MSDLADLEQSVSRETRERLEEFQSLLLKWNSRINLVSPTQVDQIWERHILDSAQLFRLTPPDPDSWLDLGSGGGFPGIVCAILSQQACHKTRFHLVESDQRKSIFLRQAAQALDLCVTVHTKRVEQYSSEIASVISARALAPLPKLLSMAAPFLDQSTQLLFLKGKRVEMELTEASESWNMTIDRIQSLTDPDGVVLRLSGVSSRT